jgi:hypothetical protein
LWWRVGRQPDLPIARLARGDQERGVVVIAAERLAWSKSAEAMMTFSGPALATLEPELALVLVADEDLLAYAAPGRGGSPGACHRSSVHYVGVSVR